MENSYWLCVKNPNHLHTEISLGYLKDTKFYLESKASFIHISSIASFKPFLIAWLWEYCTFSVSSVVSLKSSSWPQYTQYGTIFPKKSCSTIKLFFFFKYVLYLRLLQTFVGLHRSILFFIKKIKVCHLRYYFSKKFKENIKTHASY